MTKRFGKTYFEKYGEQGGDLYERTYQKYTILPHQIQNVCEVNKHPKVLDEGAADGRLLRDYHKTFGGPEENYHGLEISTAVKPIFGRIANADIRDTTLTGQYDIIIVNCMMYMNNGLEVLQLYQKLANLLSLGGVLATTVFTSWEYGQMENDAGDVWKDFYLTGHFKNGRFYDDDNHREVSFGAPQLWWVNTMKIAGLQTHWCYYGDDIFIHKQGYHRPEVTAYAYPSAERFTKQKHFNPYTILFDNGTKAGVKLKRDESDDLDSSAYHTCDMLLNAEQLAALVALVNNGSLGPVRRFKFKLDQDFHPQTYVRGCFIDNGIAYKEESA